MRPHPKDEDLSGKKVGEYDILSRIGAGGMGAVYEGVQPMIGKRVAVKVLLPQLSSDAELVERFLSEARAVNAIRHRGIIDIFSFGQLPSGQHYFVMEYLDGEPFDQLIKARAPISAYDVLSWTEEVLDALDAAHTSGIIHRDIKPSNLFLVNPPRGRPYVKLLDFGVAKLGALKGEATPETRASVIIGTPDYMSPEQARGRKISPATDLYALGCVMFELLTGKRLFKGENPMQTMFMHVENQPARVSELVREAPPELDELLLWTLEKDPEKRPQSAGELKQHVEAVKAIVPNEKTQSFTSLPRIVLSGGPVTPGPGSGSRARLGTPAPKSSREPSRPQVRLTSEGKPTDEAMPQGFEADPTRIVPGTTKPEVPAPTRVEVAAATRVEVPAATRVEATPAKPEPPAMTRPPPSAPSEESVAARKAAPKLMVLGALAFSLAVGTLAFFFFRQPPPLSPSRGEGRGEGTQEKAKATEPAEVSKKAEADKQAEAETKAAEQKAAEQKAAEQKAAEQKAAEQKAAEQKAAEQKAAEQKAAEQKAAEQKAVQQKAAQQKAAEQAAAEKKPTADKKPPPTKPKSKAYTAEEVASRILSLEQRLAAKEAKTGSKDRVLRQFLDQAKAQAAAAKTDEDRKELWGFLTEVDKQLRQ